MLDSWAKIHRLIRSTHGSSANSKSTLLVAMWHACRSKSQNKGEWWAQAPTSPVLAMLKGHFRYCTAGDMLMLETCRSEIKQINKLQLFPWLSVRFLCLKMLMHWSPVPSPCCPNSNEINPNVDFSMSSTTWLMALDGGSNQLAAHVFLCVSIFSVVFQWSCAKIARHQTLYTSLPKRIPDQNQVIPRLKGLASFTRLHG